MVNMSRVSFISPEGNEALARTVVEAGFEVLSLTDVEDAPPGIILLDLLSPKQIQKYLFGKRDLMQEYRSRGYTVLASVAPDTLRDDHAALSIGSAHAFLLKDERPASTRATILAAIHRRALDDRLMKSESRYRLLAEHVGDVIWTWDIQAERFDYISPSIVQLRGLTVEEALAERWDESMTPGSAKKSREQLESRIEARREGVRLEPLTDYYDQPCKDGSIKTVEMTISFIDSPDGRPTHALGVSRDATERMRNKVSLENALHQRELLLKELEHRVKNTLTMIGSLLSLASGQVRNDADAELFEESQARVSAMALVYEKLLRSPDAVHIDLGTYLEDLCRAVTSTFAVNSGDLDLSVERKEYTVDSKKAALLGLVVNELITNSLKYASIPDRPLRLRLDVHPAEQGGCQIRFQDNGPGLSPGFDIQNSEGLGFLLMRNLISQVKGNIAIEPSDSGAIFLISIPSSGDAA